MTPPTDTEIVMAFKIGHGVKNIAEHYALDIFYVEEAIRRYIMDVERGE